MPAWRGKHLDLPMPVRRTLGVAVDRTVMEVRMGLIRARVVGMDPAEYVFPCMFLDDPNAAPTPTGHGRLSLNLLGLTGVVEKLRLITEDTRAAGFPVGKLIVEKI